ncbi:pyridoxal-phosphate dependent TrpB-like enzyme [Pyrolobus fumarii 1A]|uniref:Tryptophan synthase beta chain n=1 Tax=Pyrolobus fumarii (strain DSM 11204 / 1A) TaxID=694429 RepID=G0EF56_PYRF1|nr:TrpB-like pyridoxal phosphate-dependent enzyme [Pyrolobus fumarii]AEM38953.1 pyridoxal-phosphate dependent TrpB-like enzyme [Pyrolobus fumarii 1A]
MVDVPSRWYNIVADLPVPLPPLIDPLDDEGSRIQLLVRILPSRLIDEEYTLSRFLDIPDEVRAAYRKVGRPTPLIRAEGLEKALGVHGRVRIYYKFEGALPTGSHKINTAIPQVYYAKLDGANEVATETGAGQWGLAVATAAAILGMKATIFMTRSSYHSKRQRRLLMQLLGATVHPSPSEVTEAGRRALRENPEHPGSLGLAITEAVEYVLSSNDRRYVAGSVLESVLTHQTVIGMEVLEQLPEEPDYMIACVGGGSNMGGFSYPALGMKLRSEGFEKTRFIAAEATAVPRLSKGEYRYDGLDTGLVLPLAKMYTLGKDYVPPPIHAAGLRYHGAAPSLSLLRKLGYIEARAYTQEEVYEAGKLFARSEGIIPAPESTHAIRAVIDIAKRAPQDTVIVFNLSGHGLLDTDAFEKIESRIISGRLPQPD